MYPNAEEQFEQRETCGSRRKRDIPRILKTFITKKYAKFQYITEVNLQSILLQNYFIVNTRFTFYGTRNLLDLMPQYSDDSDTFY